MVRPIKIRTACDGDGDKLYFTAEERHDGVCIKDILKKELVVSGTLITKVKFGGVLINGTAVTMRATVHEGDEITVVLPIEKSEFVEPIDAPLTVLYEDEHFIAVDKPTGMPVHPSRGNHLVTLASVVTAYVGTPFVFRAINRLDRDTSGIVIIAKNQYSASLLSTEMKAGGFEKYYTALLANAPREEYGIIDAPIERECEGSIKRTVTEGGKRAVTEYRVREILSDGRAVCDIRLHTGRTHQIRVHMAHIGAPLYADFLYGERMTGEIYSLRCSRILLTHPITRERIEIKAE
ncbi:MAG: RluA family pseudouridine synthase [Clostridia bacterium]|nr:RluA family pseudouridine synthase [Clostridia bacterium]